jgi:hypothetical protein
MTTTTSIELFLALVVGAYLVIMAVTYIRMRGTRLVICPETREPAAVTVDAGHAAMSALRARPEIRLLSCSCWPEREGCRQACASQIEAAPKETLASERVKAWVAGRTCAMCGQAFGPWQTVGPQPGLLDATTRQALRWDDIPPEQLPSLFESHLPVCKYCQMVEEVRGRYPELASDRSRPETRAH